MKRRFRVIFFIIVVILLSSCGKEEDEVEVKYSEALKMYNEGNLAEAEELFFEIQEFNDCKEYIDKIEESKISEEISYGLVLYENKDYVSAYSFFSENYERFSSNNDFGGDIDEIISVCKEKIALEGHSKYQERKYDEAESLLSIGIDNGVADYREEYKNSQLVNKYVGNWYYINPYVAGFDSLGSINVSYDEISIGDFELDALGQESFPFNQQSFSYNVENNRLIAIEGEIELYGITNAGYGTCSIEVIADGKHCTFFDNPDYYNIVNKTKMEKEKTPTVELKEPYLGMTAEEVRKSTWGEPKTINKSTYWWGVHEQWCYSGYRYIYLEDGIVTSIQEHINQ